MIHDRLLESSNRDVNPSDIDLADMLLTEMTAAAWGEKSTQSRGTNSTPEAIKKMMVECVSHDKPPQTGEYKIVLNPSGDYQVC